MVTAGELVRPAVTTPGANAAADAAAMTAQAQKQNSAHQASS